MFLVSVPHKLVISNFLKVLKILKPKKDEISYALFYNDINKCTDTYQS